MGGKKSSARNRKSDARALSSGRRRWVELWGVGEKERERERERYRERQKEREHRDTDIEPEEDVCPHRTVVGEELGLS